VTEGLKTQKYYGITAIEKIFKVYEEAGLTFT